VSLYQADDASSSLILLDVLETEKPEKHFIPKRNYGRKKLAAPRIVLMKDLSGGKSVGNLNPSGR